MKGLSPRNLKYMRAFAKTRPDPAFAQGVLAQLPWHPQITLLNKLSSDEQRRRYATKAIEHNWSRNPLAAQIETRLLERSGQAVTNLADRLPAPMSDLARESLKHPYRVNVLGLEEKAIEAIEQA